MEEINEFNKKISELKSSLDIATPLKIVVINVCAVVSSRLDLQTLYDNRHLRDTWSFKYKPLDKKNVSSEIIVKTKTKTTKIKKDKSESTFYNCIIIDFKYNNLNISCKVFPNGKLQITGLKTISDAHEIPVLLFNFIKDVKQTNIYLKDQKIGMINSNFLFNKTINQELLKNIINDKYKYNGTDGFFRIATFNPEQFPGINIKFWTEATRLRYKKYFNNDLNIKHKKIPTSKIDGQISIFIFRTGKVTITAAKTTNELAEAYLCITSLVYKHKEVLIN